MKKYFFFAMAAILSVVSCSKEPEAIAVTGVSLDNTTLTMAEGGTASLVCAVMPANATNQAVFWKSSDALVVSVDQNGVLTAHKAGTANIEVKTGDGGFTAACIITVASSTIAVTGVTLNKEEINLTKGSTFVMVATVAPSDATNKNVTWSSDNVQVATIDENGNLTALAPGTSVIKARTVDGGFEANCVLTVTSPVSGVYLNNSSIGITVNSTYALVAGISPENATDKKVTWESSNPEVASVDDVGNVRANAVGSAQITVTTNDGGHKAVCNVTVTSSAIAVTGITLDKETISLKEGDVDVLVATVTPANASNKNVNWASSNPGIVTVEPSGKITAKAAGTALVTAAASEGGYAAACAVTVTSSEVAVTGVTLSKTDVTLTVGSILALSPTFTPSNATDKQVTWESSNPGVASVDGSGNVNAIAAGTAVITVKTHDGGFTAACNVTVPATSIAVNNVTLNKTTLKMTEGETSVLVATVEPTNATNRNVNWTTSDASVVTVDNAGRVTAKAAGTALVTATSSEGGYKASCAVTVVSSAVAVTGVTLSKSDATLTVGSTLALAMTITPSNATDKQVTWESSKPEVVSVDAVGNIRANSAGSAQITVTTNDGGYKAVCNVTVASSAIAVKGVSLDRETISLKVGSVDILVATVAPADASDKNVNWASSNPDIVIVEASGKITAIATGTALVTVTTSEGGYKASCAVTVTSSDVPVTGVTLSRTDVSLTVGSTFALASTVAPSNATDKQVTWESSKPEVASVDAVGNVRANSAGSAQITVTAHDGGHKAVCNVTVTSSVIAVTGVTLDRETISLKKGDIDILVATVAPADASNKNVNWTSSNPDIVSVEPSGKITAIATGTALVTATASEGGYKASCAVTVTASSSDVAVTGVTLNASSQTIKVGSLFALTATVNPNNATNRNVTWSSSNSKVATVSEAGVVTGIAEGEAVITVTTVDGGKTATCKIVVKKDETGGNPGEGSDYEDGDLEDNGGIDDWSQGSSFDFD